MWSFNPLTLATLTSLTLLTPILALDSWYTPPGGPPTGSGFNSTLNPSSTKIKGVNLGGWLILENWMTPSIFGVAGLPGKGDEDSVMDEWGLCERLGKARCEEVLEEHWESFYTEDDFKRMADYGLNTVRIPVPYWIWNVTESEPFITGAQIPHLQRALNWSYVYGLDVILDMHALPGSQSSYQVHTGLYAQEGFSNSTENMDRALNAIEQMVAEFTKPEYGGVVTAIELVNEPWIEAYMPNNMPWELLEEFMVKAYDVVRSTEEIIPGRHEVMVIVHDAFGSLTDWTSGFFAPGGKGHNWTNYALDTHVYQAWSGIAWDEGHIESACAQASYLEEAQRSVPVIVGEFSLGVQTFCVDYKDCFNLTLADALANITSTSGDRDMFLRAFWEAQMHAYEHAAGWIFWNFKTELAPTWSYDQSVAQNWVPLDLADRVWQYDASQAYCLQNQNWSNIPDFTPNNPAPLKDGTATPVREAMTLAVQGALLNSTSTSISTSATTTGSVTATVTGASASLTGTPTETGIPTSTGALNAALRHLMTSSWTWFAVAAASGMILMN